MGYIQHNEIDLPSMIMMSFAVTVTNLITPQREYVMRSVTLPSLT
ncbi:hypothetical protein [Candidatus Endolissoclinum faulkneri]|nr:hypothetical protein [Candidatus Endolissoclinum faulkneri]